MTPTFEKLKKGHAVITLIKSALMAIAAGLFTVGGMLLAFKLAEKNFPVLYMILIGLGVGLLAGVITFLILRRSAKAIAKRLDKEYVMHEKVQTMLEYSSGETEMVQLQRQDAEEKLQVRTKGKAKLGKIWIGIGAVAISLATFVTGMVLPSNAFGRVPSVDGESLDLDIWHYEAMLSLIAYVDESPMHQNAKPTVKTELQSLLDDVCSYDEETRTVTTLMTKSEITARVSDSIVYLDEYVEGFNTYKTLYRTLMSTQSALVMDFAKAFRALEVGEEFDDLRAKMDDQENYSVEGIALIVDGFAEEIIGSFNMTEIPVPETDELLVTSIDFVQTLKDLAQDVSVTYLVQKTSIDSTFELKKGAIDEALVQQDDNRTSFNYVIAELVKIFEISDPPYTGGESLPSIEGSNDGGGNDVVSGAPGSGGVEYGSNETIYYPDEQEHKKYGDVYNEYDAKKDEIMGEQEIDDALKELIDSYFEKLGGSGADSDGSQTNG